MCAFSGCPAFAAQLQSTSPSPGDSISCLGRKLLREVQSDGALLGRLHNKNRYIPASPDRGCKTPAFCLTRLSGAWSPWALRKAHLPTTYSAIVR
jgi:hypothetical protein